MHGGEEEREEIQRRSAREMMGRFFLGIVIVSIALIIALYWHIVALYLTDPAFQAVRTASPPNSGIPAAKQRGSWVNMKRAGETLTVGGSGRSRGSKAQACVARPSGFER